MKIFWHLLIILLMLTIGLFLFSLTNCSRRPELITIQSVLTNDAGLSYLSVSTIDSLPRQVKESLHKGLMGRANIEVAKTTEANRIILSSLEQTIRYDIWNKTYLLTMIEKEKTTTIYLYQDPFNKESFPLENYFPRFDRHRLPIKISELDHIEIRLRLIIEQISDSEHNREWSRETSQDQPAREDTLRFGLNLLVDLFLGDAALLSYDSGWIKPETKAEEKL